MIDKQQSQPIGSSIDKQEIEKFSALANEWWDPEGSFRALHVLNPIRLTFIRDQICSRFKRDKNTPFPFEGLRLADIGCGGGLLTEPMTRLGASVVGYDASERNIMIARNHAERMKLSIDYRFATVESAVKAGEQFDVVLNMEVLEHVANVNSFINACCQLLAPGGIMIVATLNRTFKSFALAIVGAEFVLRWIPRGTHQWGRFIRPSELASALRREGIPSISFTGLVYDPLRSSWRLDERDLSVNYLACAIT